MRAFTEAWFSQPATDLRTPLTLEREQYLFFHPATPRFRAWMAIIPCVTVQAVLGSFYSTSVYNKQLDHDSFGAPGVAARMFVACVASYGAGTLLLGSWIASHGVFASVRRSLLLTPLGWLCASAAAASGQQALLYAYGLLHGLGCAHAYLSTTSCLTQWYPRHKGLVSGLAVFGAGLGSFCWTLVGRALMDPAGAALAPAQAMRLLAGVFFLLLALALPFLRNPPPNYKGEAAAAAGAGAPAQAPAQPPPAQPCRCLSPGPPYSSQPDQPYTCLSTLRTLDMRLALYTVFAVSLPGVVFLSSAADMASNIFGLDTQSAALVTAYLNLANFTGRFLWGWVTDKIGRKSFWVLAGAAQSAALLAMPAAILQGERGRSLWMACFLLVGSLYGGLFGVLPAFLSDMFGARISPATHGLAIFFWSLACVVGAPVFAAVNAAHAVRARAGEPPVPSPAGYAVNALWLAAAPASALLAVALLNVRREDRRAAARTRSLRARCGSSVCVAGGGSGGGGCRLLSAAQQEEEYAALGVRVEEEEGAGEGGAPAAAAGEGKGAAEGSAALPAGAGAQPEGSGGVHFAQPAAAAAARGSWQQGLLLSWEARMQAWEDNSS